MSILNKIRMYLFKLLFPELTRELKQIDENFKYLANILKRHDNILRGEVWKHITEKYQNEKT